MASARSCLALCDRVTSRPQMQGLELVQSPPDARLALVLGNEVHGVPPDVLAQADLVVGLPQYGVKASLNVSVAFGVAAYGLVARARAVLGSG